MTATTAELEIVTLKRNWVLASIFASVWIKIYVMFSS
jgi:hypothetical protein